MEAAIVAMTASMLGCLVTAVMVIDRQRPAKASARTMMMATTAMVVSSQMAHHLRYTHTFIWKENKVTVQFQ